MLTWTTLNVIINYSDAILYAKKSEFWKGLRCIYVFNAVTELTHFWQISKYI